MPSVDHELYVDMFRHAPRLAPELLRRVVRVPVPEGTPTLGSIDLSQLSSASYAADAVVEIHEGGRVQAAIIVEVQRSPDPDKRQSWPVYVTALRARHGCPVLLLVVAGDDAVARWARQPIELGHPGFCLVPLVVTAHDAPAVDRPEARALPELAVLAALGHPDDEGAARVAAEALAALAEERARLYFDVMWAAITDRVRAVLETWMQKHEYQSDFARKYFSQGREEGLEQGREEGREEGQLGALRAAALRLLTAKLGSAPSDLQDRLAAMGDVAKLERLVVDLGVAQDEQAARAILESLLGEP